MDSSLNASIVNLAIFLIWLILLLCEAYLWIPTKLKGCVEALLAPRTATTPRRVVIVGGSFAGLAALWEFLRYPHLLEVVLIDQKNFFEYTPGILRLFCQPSLFPKLAKLLPVGPHHKVVEGRVTSISVASRTQETKKCVSYISSTSKGTQVLSYDYLILATGSSYAAPITSDTTTQTLDARRKEWKSTNTRLRQAKRVLILGGGAVGVELAAEIVDFYGDSKQVTLLDANKTLVTNFPKQVRQYAKNWLESRKVELILGHRLVTWNASSCTLEDGKVISADVVFVCFGGKPNTDMMYTATSPLSVDSTSFSIDQRNYVHVDSFLRVKGGPFADESVFACGDISSPDHGHEKQALQAEMQGKVAARNVLQSLKRGRPCGDGDYRYPQDIAGSHVMPLVFVLSLGRFDGVLGFNGLCIPGPFAAIVKWILEYTKVIHMAGRSFGRLIWMVGDAVVLFLSRTLLKPESKQA